MKTTWTKIVVLFCLGVLSLEGPGRACADTEGTPSLSLYPSTLSLALNSPSPAPDTAPALQDLGFSQSQTEGNAQDQALLDKRSHMLQLHQRWGLATTVPLAATIFLAPGGKSGTFQRTLHGSLGLLTAGMYGTTAYYAFGAPTVPGTKVKGPIRVHKALVWIHFPGMILTPILGAMADEQRNAGEKVHGIASAHSEVAAITIASYAAAILSVSIKF